MGRQRLATAEHFAAKKMRRLQEKAHHEKMVERQCEARWSQVKDAAEALLLAHGWKVTGNAKLRREWYLPKAGSMTRGFNWEPHLHIQVGKKVIAIHYYEKAYAERQVQEFEMSISGIEQALAVIA